MAVSAGCALQPVKAAYHLQLTRVSGLLTQRCASLCFAQCSVGCQLEGCLNGGEILALGSISTGQQLFSVLGYDQHGHGNVLMQVAGCVLGLLLTLYPDSAGERLSAGGASIWQASSEMCNNSKHMLPCASLENSCSLLQLQLTAVGKLI